MSIPSELVQAVAWQQAVIFIGNDNKLAGLARKLAAECAYQGDVDNFPEVALAYESEPGYGRNRLVTELKRWLTAESARPTQLQRQLAQLPSQYLVDLSYDSGLQQALNQAQKPATLIVRDDQIAYADPKQLWLVKPYGLIDQPSNFLLLTEAEYYRRHIGQSPDYLLLLDLLREWLASRPILWLNVDFADPYWLALHQAVTQNIGLRHRREYVVTTDNVVDPWVEQGITPLITTDTTTWLAQLATEVAELPPRPVPAPPSPTAFVPGQRPYKFLDYYTAADADLFFGRAQWIEQLISRIQIEPLTVLLGRSGVGKTSLLRAGLIPELQATAYWPIYARPGQDPVEAIRTAALTAATEAGLSPPESQAELGDFLQQLGQTLNKTPLIILDQAEECFTALPEPIRWQWVTTLARANQRHSQNIRWLLSLREDFIAELHDWTVQLPQLLDRPLRLAPLSRAEAKEAIEQPLQQVGATIEPLLLTWLLDDLELNGVDPAQLQIVCDRLFQQRSKNDLIQAETYRTLGGTSRILADYLDVALAQLTIAERELAVAILKGMVTGRATKLPLAAAEIFDPVAGAPAQKETILSWLVKARLVRSLTWGRPPAEERRYELTHDVLAEKIKSWINAHERAAQRARDLLRQEQLTWQRLELLPEKDKVIAIYEQRHNPYLRLSQADLGLMLRAALRWGLAPAEWTQLAVDAALDPWPILAPALTADDELARQRALWALTGWNHPQALDSLKASLADPSPRVRVTAHQALFQLGTPAASSILADSDDLRLVPAGTFILDEGNEAHELYLEAFFIEKYPVTNEKFSHFIDAGGYQLPDYWTTTGWRWRRRTRRSQPTYWQNDKWNGPQQPVNGLTWHEAWAYARWAGRRLLSEAEWEKAATWDPIAEQKYRYPWGNDFDPEKCNTKEAGPGQTTPVGQYSPQGDSPCGAVDMAGNVWEWTSTLYRDYPYRSDDGRENREANGTRVQRGGSYYNSSSLARGGSRDHYNPGSGNVNNGVRCGVVSRPSSPFMLDADS